MTLANPLGLLAALLAVPLTVWYLLRSRRPRVAVASTFLWRSRDESVTAALPWQRFRPDLSYWLVLFAILAGAVALARPTFAVEAALGDHTIVLVDASASMLADEDGPSRLELARREATTLVSSLGPGQTVSVVEAADRARVVLSSSGDAAAVRRALASIRPAQGAADLGDAFTLAAALQRPGTSTVLHLYTDGAVPDADVAAAPPGLQVHGVGSPRPNLGVSRLQAVPAGAGSAQVFVQVRNFGALPETARLTLRAGDVELDAREVELAPRGSADVVTEVVLPDPGDDAVSVLRATVTPLAATPEDADRADRLAVDDTAATVVSGQREVVVLVAGPGNVFLESALGAVDGIEVRTTPAVPDDLTGVDLLVVDRAEAPAVVTVPTLLVAPTRAPDGVTLGPAVAEPAVTFADPGAELLRDVDLSSLAVAEAAPLSSPSLATIAGGPEGALVAAGRLGGQPVVVLGFDLLASNLPLDVAWPVFVANTVSWLTGPPASAPVVAGADVELNVPQGAAGVAVTPPTGTPLRLDAAAPRFRADQVGVWLVAWTAPEAVLDTLVPPPPVAVNAVPEEGDLSRPPALDIPSALQAAPGAPAAEGRRSIGPGILAVVLVLLCTEWAHAHGVRPLAALRRRRAARSGSARGSPLPRPARGRRKPEPKQRVGV